MPAGIDDAVIMPVYNEETTVGMVIDAVRLYHHRELIIVDDGSTDRTAEVLGERDDILVVNHPENMGYGKSLIDAFVFAQFAGLQRVITMDCDGQHEPAHIPEFFDVMDETDAEIVSGSRYLPESRAAGVAPPDRREVNERVTAEINAVTGWGLTDAFCGFKGYRLDAVLGLGLGEPGYGMPMELWAKAYNAGLRVEERPVERIYCDHDRSFGGELDDAEKRFAYYMRVWHEALDGAS
jgi:dolichol-phosphate mannosyltransferase